QEAVGVMVPVQPEERALREHLLEQECVLRIRSVDPVDPGGLAEAGGVLAPRAQGGVGGGGWRGPGGGASTRLPPPRGPRPGGGRRQGGVGGPGRGQGGGRTGGGGASLEEPRNGIPQPVPTGLVELDGGGGKRPLQGRLDGAAGGWIFGGREVPYPARSIGKG